jgi:GAF domain
VSANQQERVAAAVERLRAESSVPALLALTARSFVDVLDAQACTISRIIGDLLVDLIQHDRSGQPNQLGHGYLISDYPLTRAVIEEGAPRTVFRGDPDADPSEAALLGELGFDSLLMLPITTPSGPWALVEIYGVDEQQFSDEEIAAAQNVASAVSETLWELGRPA